MCNTEIYQYHFIQRCPEVSVSISANFMSFLSNTLKAIITADDCIYIYSLNTNHRTLKIKFGDIKSEAMVSSKIIQFRCMSDLSLQIQSYVLCLYCVNDTKVYQYTLVAKTFYLLEQIVTERTKLLHRSKNTQCTKCFVIFEA